MILLLLLFANVCFVSTQKITPDPVDSFLQRYVDDEISPCENFYRHVCPKNITRRETLGSIIEQHWFTMFEEELEYLRQKYPVISEVLEKRHDGTRKNRKYSEQVKYDHIRSLSKRGIANKAEYKVTNLDRIKKIITHLAWQRIIRFNPMFEDAFAKVKVLFNELFEEQIRVLLEAKWVEKHNGKEYAESILRAKVHLYDFKMSESDRNDFIDFLDSVENKFTDYMVTQSNGTDFEKMAVMDWSLERAYEQNLIQDISDINTHNARNRGGKVFIFLPYIYMVLLENDAFVYSTLGYTISHEIGHSIGTVKNSVLKYITNSTECIVKHMEDVCERQQELEVKNCLSGCTTLGEDITDGPSIKRTIQVFKDKYNPTKKQMLDFFYGVAVDGCDRFSETHPRYANGVPTPHSMPAIRVNAILMQIDDFAETFNCKQGDFMTIPESKKCHIYGREASADKTRRLIK